MKTPELAEDRSKLHHLSPIGTLSIVPDKSCEEEQIRIPGSIQQHGFFLLLGDEDKCIVAASENAQQFLGLPLRLILGSTLDTLLERELVAALKALSISEEAAGAVTYLGSFQVRDDLYSVVTHRIGQQRALELERIDKLVRPELMNAVITNFVGKLNQLSSELDLCIAIAKQVKDLTGFNRVLLYTFDQSGHGLVLAEENDGALPSYAGLRFPGFDIPQQARQLYILNTVRIIPDATYQPSPLHGLADQHIATLDLSLSLLRSVSPVHLEYMRNMGTVSSMSISIVCDGKLWGLISGHHATPRTVPYLIRSACDLLTKMVSTQLIGIRTTEKLGRMVHFHNVQRKMLTQMAAENDYIAGMVSQLSALIEVTDANGVALIVDGSCKVAGETPDIKMVLKLVDFLNDMSGLELFETRHLQDKLQWANSISNVASGILAIRISDVRQSYIIWFRPELVRTIKWAGEPAKLTNDEGKLRPRTSFLSWIELVRGQSVPWTEMEIESAWEFRAAVMTINLRRAEEAAELSEARFQQLTHALPNLIWTSNDEGNLTYVNQKWRDQGLGEQGLWYDQGRVIDEDKRRCAELWKIAVDTGMPFEAEIRFMRAPDDIERWYLVRAIPFLRSNQSRAGWVGTSTDLTDRREREIALRMTEKLALTGRMTSVIAHEINNPLEAITNLLFLLRDHIQENSPAKNYISMAESELQRISGITKQTLRWSRDDTQKEEYESAGVLFDDVQRLFAGKIRNREVTVTIGNDRDARIFGVIGQLRQVLTNLVSNAIDAVPVGGAISLEAIQGPVSFQMVVSDNGPGMSQDTQRLMFQPFYTTKGDLGNGLGLYISQEIVERHKGRLVVNSVSGQGTRIEVHLPNAVDNVGATQQQTS